MACSQSRHKAQNKTKQDQEVLRAFATPKTALRGCLMAGEDFGEQALIPLMQEYARLAQDKFCLGDSA
jgi:hypothetical protein